MNIRCFPHKEADIKHEKMGFGFMRLPLRNAENDSSVDVEQVKKMVDQFMAHGFTYFDTAAPYHGGKSEVALRGGAGKALSSVSIYHHRQTLPVYAQK